MQNNVLTASRQNCFQVCPRRHYWQYEIGLLREGDSKALFIGSAWHRAMDARWQGKTFEEAFACALPDGQFMADAYTVATIAGLLKAYYDYWGDEEREGVQMQTEQQFKLPLVGSKNFTVEGIIDRIGVKADGRQVQVEYKTTGESLQPDSAYWLRLRFNTQLLQYFLAARALGWTIEEVVYDVTRKPSIQPKEIYDLDENNLKIVVDATGKRVFNEKGKSAGEPRQTADKERGWLVKSHIETAEEFGERLFRDALSRPDFYFARREVPILESDLKDFAAQRLSVARTIQHHRKMGEKLKQPEFAWPRHVGEQTCKFCSYQGFCLQNISIDLNQLPQGFAVKPFNPELSNDPTQEIESASVV